MLRFQVVAGLDLPGTPLRDPVSDGFNVALENGTRYAVLVVLAASEFTPQFASLLAESEFAEFPETFAIRHFSCS